ncbi:GH21155 [Drosophila grimshawi]|uniref:GH21155 n=1 Tax=Drosophila grimshawi TaxID=7222 RepID=B4J6M0_DROGR|nr:GH21155 [Drosophila grimshawi]
MKYFNFPHFILNHFNSFLQEGSIGHDMVIKPLPHELSPNKEQAQHIVYKREAAATDDQLSDFAFMEPDDLLASEKLERLQRRQQRRRRRSSGTSPDFEDLNDEDEGALDGTEAEPQTSESRIRPRRQTPYVIYPEVLVIVDYDGYRLHGGDNLQVKRYFISFWNGVDLRYRLLKGPRIRISIAGIIISRGRDATPYLERNRVGRDAIDSAAALTDMGKYLFRERRLPVYDIAVAITKLDMCRRTSAFGECNRGTAGFAYVGGACVVNKRLEKVNSVAIIEDTGGFSGIIVAAHEVGHLLGAVHDGSPPPSYLGGPGAQRCRWEDGYIMSDLRHTERGFRWSACTVQSFHHFLNGDTATCLHNAPHEDSALGRSLPGTLLSLDAQCRRDRGTYACFKDERVCAQLFCFDAQTGYCVAYRPAAEGSACGNGYHCLDGRCTPLPSNIIPDYGNNYRLVYNATTNSNTSNQIGAKEQNSNNNNSEEVNKRQQQQQQLVDEENEANAGIEINEAIERQKRKFHSQQQQQPRHLTTLQHQQQQQQLSTPTTTSTASATTAAKPAPTPTTTTTKLKTTSSIFDAYFKKFQALHLPTLDGAVTATTTSVSTSVSSSTTKAGSTQQQQQQQQKQQEKQQQQQHRHKFDGSQFLKRTLNRSSITQNKNSSNKVSSNSHNHSQQQQQQQQLLHQQQQEQTSPSYATNYIGDNTNNLPTVLDNEPSTTTTTAIQQLQQQQQQSPNGPTTPRKPKIKTQKLIRRTRVM